MWYFAPPGLQFYLEYPKEQSSDQSYSFNLYVNDISSGISSTVKLYADDIKVYREISDIARDTSILQSDLFHLRNWSEVWKLNFNAKKCEIM